MTPIQQNFEKMSFSFRQELSDASSYVLQRQAEYDSREMIITSTISAANSLLALHGQKVDYCEEEVKNLNQFYDKYPGLFSDLGEKTQLRKNQSELFASESKLQSERDIRVLDMLTEIHLRIQKEINSKADVRGNGVSFDEFVADHPLAFVRLNRGQELVDSLKKLVQEKMGHTATALAKMTTILDCSECQANYKSVNDLYSSFPISIQVQSLDCETLRNDTIVQVWTEKVRFAKEQLIQLHNDDAVQQKAELQRADAIKTQLAGLEKLRTTAQF